MSYPRRNQDPGYQAPVGQRKYGQPPPAQGQYGNQYASRQGGGPGQGNPSNIGPNPAAYGNPGPGGQYNGGGGYPSRGPGGYPPQGGVPHPAPQQQPPQQPQQRYASNNSIDPNFKRKQEYDKLIHDCYSKYTIDASGRKILETSYQTHINIREYSQFPSQPPPENLPDSQVGSVKDRVLVICAKSSGRVILQKGKFNEIKDAYQIGRTWDMDELKSIARVGNYGLILSLNKDYYWRVDDGIERIWKFARVLALSYGNFIGRYPELHGFSLQDLKLPPNPPGRPGQQSSSANNSSPQLPQGDIVVNDPIANPQLLKSKSLKRKNMPNPVLPPEPAPLQPSQIQQAKSHYKDIDFTANGKLPMKPMLPMQVDRGSSNTRVDQPDNTMSSTASSAYKTNTSIPTNGNSKRNSHPYVAMSTGSPNLSNAADTSLDSQNFVFQENRNSHSSEKLEQYAKEFGSNSPLRNYKPRKSSVDQGQGPRKVSDLETSAAIIGLQNFDDPNIANTQQKQYRRSNDFGIEEVEDNDDSEEEEKPLFARTNTRKDRGLAVRKLSQTQKQKISSSPEVIEESTNLHDDEDTVSSSIQEIESFMESHLDMKKGNTSGARSITSSTSDVHGPVHNNNNFMDSESMFTSDYTNDSNLGLNIIKKESTNDLTGLEKDPEIEELLDEVNWNISDNSAALIKKLTKELNRVKFKNVEEVIALDFSNSNVSTDLTTSLSEIENLSHIFKKMEVDFQILSPEVNTIENNSEGLQVKSVNKKLLYNDLKGILSNVNMDERDLQAIESFVSFERLNKLEGMEEKLSVLFDALGTMRSNNNDSSNVEGLSSMKALKQYKATYELVTDSFVKHFKNYIKGEFNNLIKLLSRDLERISPHSLTRELNNVLIYSGFMYFLKDVSDEDYAELNATFNSQMSDLLERVLSQRLVFLKQATPSSATGDYSASSPTIGSTGIKNSRSSRSLRLSTKTKFRLRGSETDASYGTAPLSPTTQSQAAFERTVEVQDSKAIIELISYSKDLISIIQYFVGSMFHYDTSVIDFNEFLKTNPYNDRRKLLDNPSFDLTKSYSNDIIANLTSIFGGYTNLFMKKVAPQESHIPMILNYLTQLLNENKSTNQEFLVFNFIKRAQDKFKSIWTKEIKNKIESLNHSIIVAKCGILPAVKSLNQLILITESSLDNSTGYSATERDNSVRMTVDESYEELTEACTHLFLRDDPLLKNSEFDEKERQHRNVSILQNIFYLTEQLSAFKSDPSSGLGKSKSSLDSVFKKVEDAYFKRLLHKNVGKLVEFVDNYEALSKMGGQKKYNKKVVKSLISNYTHKDISMKAMEVFKKLEKHFITGGDMFEKDLLDKLWKDMESQFIDYFDRLGKIVRANFDREIEYTITRQEVHSIFSQIH